MMASERMNGGTTYPSLVNATACKQQFFAFKVQGSCE